MMFIILTHQNGKGELKILVEKLRIGKELTGRCSAKKIFMQTMDILNDAAIKTNAEVFKRKVRADIGVAGVVDKIEKVLQSSTLKDA